MSCAHSNLAIQHLSSTPTMHAYLKSVVHDSVMNKKTHVNIGQYIIRANIEFSGETGRMD
jgi:hypothetical protein